MLRLRQVLPIAAIGLSLLAASAAGRTPPDFGTTDTSVKTISAFDFHVTSGTDGPVNASTYLRTCGDPACAWAAGVSLPTGAIVTGIEVEGCDSDSLGYVVAGLILLPVPVQQSSVVGPIVDTGGIAAPGCALFTATPTLTVDNTNESYIINVTIANGNNVGFRAVRLRYRLQVSPAPATATFNDVPTNHPQFAFVEALAAAGITAGCGSGNYCPDSGLTRGQMAVFLSKALGLHFPN